MFGPGTFLGMPVLLCAGKGKRGASWPAAPEGEGGEGGGGEGQEKTSKPGGFKGAVCPVTVTAIEVCAGRGRRGWYKVGGCSVCVAFAVAPPILGALP